MKKIVWFAYLDLKWLEKGVWIKEVLSIKIEFFKVICEEEEEKTILK